MVIFKQQACAANDAATAQRVLRERAQAQRGINQKRQATPVQEPAQAQVTEHSTFEIKEPNDTKSHPKEFHRSHKTNMTPHHQPHLGQ